MELQTKSCFWGRACLLVAGIILGVVAVDIFMPSEAGLVFLNHISAGAACLAASLLVASSCDTGESNGQLAGRCSL